MGLDWFNHFDRPVWRFTPFVNAGLSNGILDTRLLSQPFRLADSFKTLGFLADAEGGMDFRLVRYVSVGGSYYELFPGGDQKVYNGIYQLLSHSSCGRNRLGRYPRSRLLVLGSPHGGTCVLHRGRLRSQHQAEQ